MCSCMDCVCSCTDANPCDMCIAFHVQKKLQGAA